MAKSFHPLLVSGRGQTSVAPPTPGRARARSTMRWSAAVRAGPCSGGPRVDDRHGRQPIGREAGVNIQEPAEGSGEKAGGSEQDHRQSDLDSEHHLAEAGRRFGAADAVAPLPDGGGDPGARGAECGGEAEEDAGRDRGGAAEEQNAPIGVEVEMDHVIDAGQDADQDAGRPEGKRRSRPPRRRGQAASSR